MIRQSLIALALIGVAGAATAQNVIVTSPPQPGPGDYTREAPGPQPMDEQAQAASPYRGTVRHEEKFRDEYGFRYDSRGDRIDAQGYRISPHTTTP